MRTEPAGDFDYEAHGAGYPTMRRADPRIAALVHAALGDARTVINVGAGAGSYEPAGRAITLCSTWRPTWRTVRVEYLSAADRVAVT